MKTELITTHSQAKETRHVEGVHFRCSCCQQTFPVQTSGGTGYAGTPKDEIICYACADKREVEDLKDRSKPFLAYLSEISSGRHHITTWTGGHLMNVVRSSHCELTRPSNWHDRNSYMSVHCVDVHGGHWHGRGSAGICIKLRPCKA